MLILEEMKRLRLLHQMIVAENTGTPDEFASKLCVSKRQLYRLLFDLEELGASIYYSRASRTFRYENHFSLNVIVEINGKESISVSGGYCDYPYIFDSSVPFYGTERKKSCKLFA